MKRKLCFILPGLAVLGLDRIVKALWGEKSAVLIPGVIALRPTRNTGMALGLFQGKTAAILIASVLLAGACLWLLRDTRAKGLAAVSLSMIAGGALGNLIDRVALGYVIDMFELLFMHFYIFNAADAGVVAGVILCAVSLLFRPQDWSRKEK